MHPRRRTRSSASFDGTVTVEVDRLQPGERFRIVTGDAEVEVRGTAFDVTAAGDRLRSVRVMHGSVEVRPAGGSVRILSPGQAWEASQVAGTVGCAGPLGSRRGGLERGDRCERGRRSRIGAAAR